MVQTNGLSTNRVRNVRCRGLQKVSPQGLQRADSGDGCGFGAQHARAEQDWGEAHLLGDIGLVGAESAFGADQQSDDGLWFWLSLQLGGTARQQDEFAAGGGAHSQQPCIQFLRGVYQGQVVATALFAGRDRDAAPMLGAFFRACAAQLGYAALGLHGQDLAGTEFGGLLHNPVHFVAAAHGLRQDDAQPGLLLSHAGLQVAENHAFAADLVDGGIQRIADTVKNLYCIADPQAQHTAGMMRGGGRELEVGA